LCELLGYDKFLPSSSGVEACESACKLARRWGYVVKGVEKDKASILMMNGCFWGRSIAACSGSDDYSRYK
jgi:ornithine--oxo-acid transaminase